MYEPIGYAYDADVHCAGCAVKRFGDAILTTSEGFEDSEGNEPGAIFEDDESDTPEHCGDCRTFLGNALTTDGYAYVIRCLADTGVSWEDSTREVYGEWYARYSDAFDDGDWRELAEAWARRIFAGDEGA